MKLGMVTYMMGAKLNIDGLIALCAATGLEGVELRTTHAHGVELDLTPAQRADVKKRFSDSPVVIAGLGTTCEFHAADPDELKRNIECAKAFAQLAADVGAEGIKLRPNGLPEGVPREKTLEQIGRAWADVAAMAADIGVETRMEVHGKETCKPENYLVLLAHADHPNAKVCWNSNGEDMDENKNIATFFGAVKDRIGLVHITDIGRHQYPWHDLFARLTSNNYNGFCLAEIKENADPERFMTFYRMLFDLYTGRYYWPR